MKTIFFLLLVCSSYLALAQSPELITREDPAFSEFFLDSTNIPQVKGRLINGSPELYKGMTIEYECIPPYPYTTRYSGAPVSEDGSFQLTIPYAFPGQQVFLSLKKYFYCQLFVTKDVFLTVDLGQLSPEIRSFHGQGLAFSGTDGEMCRFLHQYFRDCNKANYQREKAVEEKMKNGNYDLATKCRLYDQLLEEQRQADRLYLAEHPSEYGWILENRHQGEYWKKILSLHMYVENFDTPDILPSYRQPLEEYQGGLICHDCNNYYAYLSFYYSTLITNRYLKTFYQDLLNTPGLSPNDREALNEGIRLWTQREQQQPYDTAQLEKLFFSLRSSFDQELSLLAEEKFIPLLDSLFPQPKADAIKLYTLMGDDSTRLKLALMLKENVKTPWCVKILDDQIRDIRKVLHKNELLLNQIRPLTSALKGTEAVGQTDFGARLYKIDKADARELISRLQSNFPGHSLVVDIWTTWCQFCPASIRQCESYKKRLEEQPVTFLYLCSSNSSNEGNWKTKILNLRLPGIHIFVDDKVIEELCACYQLPHFFPCVAVFNAKGEYRPELAPEYRLPEFDDFKKLLFP